MRILIHLFFTWILTLALLPLCYLPLIGAEGFQDAMEKGMFLLFIGMLISIPALLICWPLLHLLLGVSMEPASKYVLWIIIVLVTAMGDGYLVFYVLFGALSISKTEVLQFVLPAMIACLVSLLFRYYYFMKLVVAKQSNSTLAG